MWQAIYSMLTWKHMYWKTPFGEVASHSISVDLKLVNLKTNCGEVASQKLDIL